jgi:hypothetical protein
MDYFKKCFNCSKYIISFGEEDGKQFAKTDLDIMNDICSCYYCPYKIIDLEFEDDGEISLGTRDEISNNIIKKINTITKDKKYYISIESLSEGPSPFSSSNNIDNIIPYLVNSLIDRNLREVNFNINFTNNYNFKKYPKVCKCTIKNISYIEN